MHRLQNRLLQLLLLACLTPRLAAAWGGWGSGEDCDNPWNGTGRGWWGNRWNDDDDNDDSTTTTSDPTQAGVISSSTATTLNNVLIAHAVLACLAWVFFFPLGAILLRLPATSPVMLRVHVACQLLTYVVYVVAAGLGVWLVQQVSTGGFSAWSDPHTGIGVAILVVAFFQPIFGYIHHKIFKKRQARMREPRDEKVPEQERKKARQGTWPGFMHKWTGRALITLGIVNGGLGIHLAAGSPFQSDETTRSASIGYAIGAGLMFLLYVLSVIVFERRNRRAAESDDQTETEDWAPPSYTESQTPSYTESQESGRNPQGTTFR
ncbi:uncharacterized protein Z518_05481 [Rhinocladiella mackenziei CBS 650.93]|uniref:Cytochrome b561 domain-containing protein n=1 Tax=Rhinocladiella mackenziei CBS 650.93 TaxID=1442369 RepID=A0A0D2INA8_9EURO|nr:uncharacterized protein Z518_05481 [Rhinocladiella mackenziei CBS 650.93]KIX04611.1 hypothetical protein Z518_05481 [Rhinocladiella mackenziei CBS 650.93]